MRQMTQEMALHLLSATCRWFKMQGPDTAMSAGP
jgi:hypothetical protein